MSKLIIPIEQYARTAAQLATENPILLDKQLVIESDTGKMKLGNGTTAYNSLPYLLVDGTTSQYVRGDGSLATFPSIPSITGLVPYTGANANVNLGTFDLTADVITGATGSFASSGNSNTFAINHSSGSGIALNITKGGSGEALIVVKTSGSGNAASITGGVTLISELHLTTNLADTYISSAATWNAKIGGSGTTNRISKFTASGTVGNSLIFDNGTGVSLGSTTVTSLFNVGNAAQFQVGSTGNLVTSGTGQFTNIGLGAAANALFVLRLRTNITGATSAYGIYNDPIVQSGVTNAAYGFYSNLYTAVASFNVSSLDNFYAENVVIGSGSSVTNQFGFRVSSTFNSATNNYGFYGGISAATNRWNVYMVGTATNYFAGNTSIGSTTTTSLFNVGNDAQFQVNQLGYIGVNATPDSQYVARIKGITTSDNSYGIFLTAGTTASDIALNIRNAADTTNYLRVRGDGQLIVYQQSLFQNNIQFSPVVAGNRFIALNNTNAGTGAIVIQAGGGSNSWGATLNLFETAHATKPGWVVFGSSVTGAKFAFNTQGFGGGTDVFSVDRTGLTVISGSLTIGSTTTTSMFNVGTSAQFQVNSSGEVAIGTTINAAAILTLTSTTKGVLFPRMTTTQKNAIVSPVAGLMVYDTTLNKLSIRTASSWETVTSA